LDFEQNLMANIIDLHHGLVTKTYTHSEYEAFNISDPKPRSIHKARVCDRLLHHTLHRELHPFFDKTFIADSYSCRKGKGTHKAIEQFRAFSNKVSKNNTKTVWVLKGDIRKFFASIDQKILIEILMQYIPDKNTISLLSEIIGSFNSTKKGVGLPLGNLTSQLFVNVYMNEFDQFVKHKLKTKYYIRYADDFVVLSHDKKWLESTLLQMAVFLHEHLRLSLHPNKVSIETLASGVDFLGWIHFPHHRQLRTTTKRRMLKNLKGCPTPETINSYLGLLGHGNTHKLQKRVGLC
ncbi:MAG: reverse transcriptase/maturase family protein, partial [Patescibacteria group bacterium]